MKKFFIILLSALIFYSCSSKKETQNFKKLDSKMNEIARNYVKLVLRIGQLDSDFVDAYYGPDSLKPHDKLITADDSLKVKIECNAETDTLLNNLEALKNYKADEMLTLRYRFLFKQLLAVKAKLFMIGGGTLSFNDESKALYDAVAPAYSKEHFLKIIDKLNSLLPGKGNVGKRLEDFRKQFIIPKDKIETVFDAAVKECKKRTLKHIKLPPGENFKVEYVSGKPWSGYNWYKGNYFSIIQVNTDLPIYIDRAIDLAAHEGYPGHHVYNCLLEEDLVKKRGWEEFTVYPLFSPQSLIAEGTANYGINMIFPGDEKIKFEKDVLFPLAGLDTSGAEKYNEVLNLLKELSFADNDAARNFLNGKWNKDETINWLENICLMTNERAEQRLRFIEKYRSYVINYNVGEEIVKNFILRNGGAINNPAKRWELFKYILTRPLTPSGLQKQLF